MKPLKFIVLLILTPLFISCDAIEEGINEGLVEGFNEEFIPSCVIEAKALGRSTEKATLECNCMANHLITEGIIELIDLSEEKISTAVEKCTSDSDAIG